MSIVLVTHAVPFSKQENLRSRAACISSSESECSQNGGSSSESKCSWNDGKKNNSKLNFFLMYFVQSNEEIHFSYKDSEK